MEHVYLKGNAMSTLGALAFEGVFRENVTIKTIDLRSNGIEHRAIVAMARGYA